MQCTLEAPIELEELFKVTFHLAKTIVLGKDGVLVEIFLALWDLVRPILLKVLKAGFLRGSFHLDITKGIIMLLVKQGDPPPLQEKSKVKTRFTSDAER